MHRCTEIHKNRDPAAPSAPALTRANTDSIETVLLSVENIISCSGLKAPYGEMFFYGVDVSDGSLGGAGSSWIDPYSDAYSTPQSPPTNRHTHAITHIKWNRADVCGRAKRCDCWLNAGSSWLSLCVRPVLYLFFFVNFYLFCFAFFLFLHSFFLQELQIACVWMPTKKQGYCKIILFFMVVNEMHIFFVSSTHLT